MQLNRRRLYAVLSANTLLRTATTATGSNALIGFYLATLAATDPTINAALAGNLNAAFDAAAILMALPLGTMIDRYSPRAVLVFGAVIGAIATQLFGIASIIPIFFVSRILEGIGQSAGQPGILAYLTDATQSTPKMRGRVMSWFEISLFLGIAFGNLIGGAMWDWLGTNAFSVMSLFYVAAALVFVRAAEPEKAAEGSVKSATTMRQALSGFSAAMSDPLLQRLALPWLLFNSVVGLWLSQLAFQLSGPVREGQWLVGSMEPTQVALFLFVYTLVFAAGVYYFGLQIGRIPRTRIMLYAFISFFGTSFCFFLINASASWQPWMRWTVLPFYMVAIAIQAGFTPAALSYLADVAGETSGRGSAMGLYTMLLSMGNIIGSLIGGYVGNLYAFNGLIAATCVFAVIGILSMFLLPKNDPAILTPVTAN